MKAYKQMVKNILADGHFVSVWDGEDWAVRKSVEYKEIIDAIESVEEAQIKVFRTVIVDGELKFDRIGWAMIIPFGVEDDETVADHTDNDYMNRVAA